MKQAIVIAGILCGVLCSTYGMQPESEREDESPRSVCSTRCSSNDPEKEKTFELQSKPVKYEQQKSMYTRCTNFVMGIVFAGVSLWYALQTPHGPYLHEFARAKNLT